MKMVNSYVILSFIFTLQPVESDLTIVMGSHIIHELVLYFTVLNFILIKQFF